MKLPRTYYAPDPNYDYDGDTQAEHEDWKTYFDDSVDEQSEAARQFAEEEAQIDYTVPDICPFCRDGNHCSCGRLEEYTDYDYDPRDDSDEYCHGCGTHYSQRYYIAENHTVCGCSPFYPDLRPIDCRNTIDYRSSSSCSCDFVKYVYLGETICSCTSPDLYALLERQHELNLTLNLVVILPDKSANPLNEAFPFGN